MTLRDSYVGYNADYDATGARGMAIAQSVYSVSGEDLNRACDIARDWNNYRGKPAPAERFLTKEEMKPHIDNIVLMLESDSQ